MAPASTVDESWETWAASPAVRAALAVHYFPGMWAWPRTIVDPLVRAALDRDGATPPERTVVEAFLQWAPNVDDFTPVRVEAEVDVAVPDPVIPHRDLATAGDGAVRYRERIPLVVLDDTDDRCWLVVHHVVERWNDPAAFTVDERALTAAWAWQTQELSLPVAGVVHDELRLDPPTFRRTRAPLSPEQAEAAGGRLGRVVLEMLDDAVRADPTFDWAHCARCPFRPPCRAMEGGEDAELLLAARYRVRPRTAPDNGRRRR